MSYYDPHIFCKQNLKESDRKELDYWEGVVHNVVENSKDMYVSDDIPPTIKSMVSEVVDGFAEQIKECLGYELQEQVVGIIDGYCEKEDFEKDMPSHDSPETYFYEPSDDEDDDIEEGKNWKHELDEVDLKELRDRFGDEFEAVVRDMLTGDNKRFKDHDNFYDKIKETDGSEDK